MDRLNSALGIVLAMASAPAPSVAAQGVRLLASYDSRSPTTITRLGDVTLRLRVENLAARAIRIAVSQRDAVQCLLPHTWSLAITDATGTAVPPLAWDLLNQEMFLDRVACDDLAAGDSRELTWSLRTCPSWGGAVLSAGTYHLTVTCEIESADSRTETISSAPLALTIAEATWAQQGVVSYTGWQIISFLSATEAKQGTAVAGNVVMKNVSDQPRSVERLLYDARDVLNVTGLTSVVIERTGFEPLVRWTIAPAQSFDLVLPPIQIVAPNDADDWVTLARLPAAAGDYTLRYECTGVLRTAPLTLRIIE